MKTFLLKHIKFLVIHFFYNTGLLFLIGKIRCLLSTRNNLIILMYHRVLGKNDTTKSFQQGLFVTADIFEKQMAFLSQHYNVISLEKACSLLNNGEKMPPKSVVITFDDGWVDNYQYAFPILAKYKLPAVIFLSTDYIGTNRVYWFYQIAELMTRCKITREDLQAVFDKLIEKNRIQPKYHQYIRDNIARFVRDGNLFVSFLKNLKLDVVHDIIDDIANKNDINLNKLIEPALNLSWEQVREMSDNNISFGSHGKAHKILTVLEKDEITAELIDSKNIMEAKLGRKIKYFAYPNGNFNTAINDEVNKAGYDCALTTSLTDDAPLNDELLVLERICIHNGMSIGVNNKYSKQYFAYALHMRK